VYRIRTTNTVKMATTHITAAVRKILTPSFEISAERIATMSFFSQARDSVTARAWRRTPPRPRRNWTMRQK
jgi:hypothetical protein